MSDIEIIVDENIAGGRLDAILSEKLNMSRNAVQIIIEDGGVISNGKPLKKNHKPTKGELLLVHLQEARPIDVVAQDIPLDIVYEDDYLLVINKAKGMVVHPAAGNWDGTLVNALLMHCGDSLSGINGKLRPGIVHRLDKDTSGLLVVAKNDIAHKSLAEQIKEHNVLREYHTIVMGNIRLDSGTISAPIGRHKTDRKRMCVTENNSKYAVTHYNVLERFNGYTYVACKLETGRTHQIRVHMAHIGHPVIGDIVYGARDKFNLEGQCLHSKSISFIHPISNAHLYFNSELPVYFQEILDKLRKMSI